MKNTELKIPALRFPEFEGEWEKKRLGEVASIITGSTPSTSVNEYYNGDKLFVSPADIQGNRIVYSTKTKLTNIGFAKGRKVKEGSVLFVCIGSTIGKVAIAGDECITNQQINSLFSKKGFENNFIFSVLEKNALRIKLLAGVQAVPQVNKTDFSNLIFLFPSLPEQQKIADFLSAVDKRLQLLKDKKTKLEEYKRGVMQRIFSQELRFTRPDGSAYPDWEKKRLGEIGAIFKGAQLNSENLLIDGEYPVLNGGVSFSGFYDRYNKEAETVTISEGGNSCGYVNLVRTKFWSGGHCYTLESLNVNIDKYYLYQYLKHKQPEIMRLRVGSGLPNIQKKDIEVFKVNLPCLDEQRQIADFLSAIDDKITLLTNQIESTEQYKKGLLQQMFV